MTDAEVTYETTTVRALRGTEARTVAKWESDGWELVAKKPGTLRTEITFRRPKPKSNWLPLVLGGVGLAIVLALMMNLGGSDKEDAVASATPIETTSEPASKSSESPSVAAPTDGSSPEQSDSVITPENNAEFAALLALPDNCDPSIAAFAETYGGQVVAFPGNIGAMSPHNGATTRYDILITAGDFSETSWYGPGFQFRDVNTVYDLHFVGDTPDTIGVGTNLDVTAEVLNYEERSCLFLLEPIATAVR